MESLKRFLMTKVKLKVSELKSAVARPWLFREVSDAFGVGGSGKVALPQVQVTICDLEGLETGYQEVC